MRLEKRAKDLVDKVTRSIQFIYEVTVPGTSPRFIGEVMARRVFVCHFLGEELVSLP